MLNSNTWNNLTVLKQMNSNNLFINKVTYTPFTYKSFIFTPLDKNIRPPSKMKKKILFTIFRLWNCWVLLTSFKNFCNNQSPQIFYWIEVLRTRWVVKKSSFLFKQVLCYWCIVNSNIILLKNPFFST